jgi:ApaG protein
MYKAITKDVKVSVETFYQESASNPDSGHFVFAYRITIENHGENTLKLLRRHWHIVEGSGEKREVEGEGVVGQQPVIEPGRRHQYISGCNLQSEMGKMYGTYLMERQIDGTTFVVEIPEFYMVVPYKYN